MFYLLTVFLADWLIDLGFKVPLDTKKVVLKTHILANHVTSRPAENKKIKTTRNNYKNMNLD